MIVCLEEDSVAVALSNSTQILWNWSNDAESAAETKPKPSSSVCPQRRALDWVYRSIVRHCGLGAMVLLFLAGIPEMCKLTAPTGGITLTSHARPSRKLAICSSRLAYKTSSRAGTAYSSVERQKLLGPVGEDENM